MHDVSNDLVVPSNLQDLFLPTAKVHSYNTRSSASSNFFINKSRLEIKRKSFSRVGARLWNELPTKLRKQPQTKFKKKIRWILFNILEIEDNYIEVETLIKKTYKPLFIAVCHYTIHFILFIFITVLVFMYTAYCGGQNEYLPILLLYFVNRLVLCSRLLLVVVAVDSFCSAVLDLMLP